MPALSQLGLFVGGALLASSVTGCGAIIAGQKVKGCTDEAAQMTTEENLAELAKQAPTEVMQRLRQYPDYALGIAWTVCARDEHGLSCVIGDYGMAKNCSNEGNVQAVINNPFYDKAMSALAAAS